MNETNTQQPPSKVVSRGRIEFDDLTKEPFRQLVIDTLSESDFITIDREGDTVVINEKINRDVEATFHPQIWINDYAHTSDETITFTVPEVDAVDENGNLLEDDSGASDYLKRHENAPPEVEHYPGPYYFTLERI